MALTTANHLTAVRMPRTCRIVMRLPGRALTGGRAAAMEAGGAASQIPSDGNPEVSDEGF